MHPQLHRIIKSTWNDQPLSDEIINFINEVNELLLNHESEKEIRAAEHAINQSEERFRKLLQYSSDVTTVLDIDGTIIYQNPPFYKILRHTESFIGKNIFDFMHPDDVDQVKIEFEKFIKKGGVSNPIEFRFRTPGNGWKYIEVIANNLLHEPTVNGIVVNSRDINERKKVEAELLRAKNEAEKASMAKSDFLSNMSHEIRTPMNAIVGLTSLLVEKQFDIETTEYLRSINYSAENLLVIINDILDFSKIESGNVQLEYIDFNLLDRINEMKNIFKHKANEKDIELKTEIESDVPEFVKGDPFRLNQILVNLVGNAVKFTLEGFVKIHVSMIGSDEEFDTINFSVQDSGIGVRKDKLETIFESFTQGYTDISRFFGGTGLGLAITKKLTLLQGGKIAIESVQNKGTTFNVELPFKKTSSKFVKTQTQADPNLKDLEGIRILLVEDNVMNQFVAKQILSKWNAEITIVNNGKEAIDILTQKDFEIVLMDLQMPEMNGYDATKIIRSESSGVRTPSIPIIALTADAFPETERKVRESEMNDFVTKPFNQKTLYMKIKMLVQKSSTVG